MKRISSIALGLIMVLFCSPDSQAQRIKTTSGDENILKGETTINIEFVYDGLSVGKYDKEADYIKAKTDEYNKKEPGRGDSWAKSWVSDRESRFEPRFINEFQDATGMTVKKDAKYTLVFKTTSIEPGYNIVISRKNAEIDAVAWIIETGKPDKKLAEFTINNAPGRIYGGYDYDTGTRIQEAYAVSGKRLGKYLK
ncbi:MAG TPA: hypothetical protein PLK54_03650 [Ferruginibacter sp.]|jgi:hypothetical protein|nr:hypothetical protein [Ferruginibacter sp.]MBN8698637.1 hypothetical protein [Chitinophagales bacterium]HMU72866.1 hypothetical protein [Ferruginibacter sp.]HMW26231.1 hypothetical protein [Ferruginibacter sp.]HMX37767.1 hypothetical protein [Ferruginibacter sp.]